MATVEYAKPSTQGNKKVVRLLSHSRVANKNNKAYEPHTKLTHQSLSPNTPS